jgi:CRP/FNR family transcriptional regulator, cyclic AMP receptor protein
MGKYSEILAESDLFNGLKTTQLDLIDSICEEQVYQKGAVIFQENSHQAELYLIINGTVEILINPSLASAVPDNAAQLEPIALLRIGQCFGEIALVDEGLRSATARAGQKNTRLLCISRERLLKFCNNYPELGYQVMKNLAIELGLKIRSSNLKAREEILYRKTSPNTSKPK